MPIDTPAQAAARFRRAAAAMAVATKTGEKQAAAAIVASVKSMSPAQLRNLGKRGTPLRLTIRPAAGGGILVAGNSGAWALWEFGAKEHMVGLGRGRTRMRTSYMRFPDGEVRGGPIHHPGMRGRHSFAKGVNVVRPAVPRIIDANVQIALRKTF